MTIKTDYIEQKSSEIFGKEIKYAESIRLAKDEVTPFPIEENLYNELFNSEWVTSYAMADDDDSMYMGVVNEDSEWLLCIKQTPDGEYHVIGKTEL